MQAILKTNLSSSQKSEIVYTYNTLVKKIAKTLSRKSIDPVEDLIQVGFIGLLEAAENFKEIHKTLFKTYATHYISGHIRHYLRDKQSLLRGPRSLQELSYKVSTVVKELTQKLERDPDEHEILETLQITQKRFDEVKSYQKKMSLIWIDQAFQDDDENKNQYNTIKLNYQINDQLEDKIILKEAMKKLNTFDKKIIELRYFNDLTQSELAQVFGLSQMDISRKLKKAEKELKKIINQ